ncbi:MAG TPA: hypothetical protein VGM80_09530 [Gaiellaceae bacterium]|jgi:hypothetical protein
MASLKDTVTLTTQLTELTTQLHEELTDGDVDFEKMVKLADQISEHADGLASAFERVNDALNAPLEQDGASNGNGSASAGAGDSGDARGSGSSGATRPRPRTSAASRSRSAGRRTKAKSTS